MGLTARLRIALMLAAAVSGLEHASAQNVAVTSGSSVTISVPTTVNGSLSVSGTSPGGTQSTYNANAPLVINGANVGLAAFQRGIFNANSDVTVGSGQVNVYLSGRLNLNSGTLTAPRMQLDGTNTFGRSGGNYSVASLSLQNGATASFESGDTISQYVSVETGGSMTQSATLTGGNLWSLGIRNGASFIRNAGTINVGYLRLTDAALELRAGDSFSSYAESQLSTGATLTVNGSSAFTSPLIVSGTNTGGQLSTLALNGDFSVSWLSVRAGGRVVMNSGTLRGSTVSISDMVRTGGNYDVQSLSIASALAYTAADTVSTELGLSTGATFTLEKALPLSDTLRINGTPQLVTNGHQISAPFLRLFGGAIFAYTPDVSITSQIQLYEGSTLALGRNFETPNSLWISGSGSGLQPNGYQWTAGGLALFDGANFTFSPGSTLTGVVSVNSGAQLSLARSLTTNVVSLSGSTSRLTTNGHPIVTGTLYVSDGATLTYGPGLSVSSAVTVSSTGILTLSDTLTVSDYVSVQTGGSIVRSSTSAGIVAGRLAAYGETQLTLRSGDRFTANSTNYLTDGATVTISGSVPFAGGLYVTGTTPGGARSTLAVAANMTASAILATNGGRLVLTSGTAFAPSFSASGSGAIIQTGGKYSASQLTVGDGASLEYTTGDSVTSNVSILSATLSLQRDLVMLDGFGGRLFIDGSSSAVIRNGHNYRVGSVELYNGAGVAFDSGDQTNTITLLNGSMLTLNANLTTSSLGLSGSTSAIVRTSQTIDAYSATLSSGFVHTFKPGDSLTYLTLQDAGTRFDANAPVALDALSLASDTTLRLSNFAASRPGGNWGLRIAGDVRSQLNADIAANRIQSGVGAGTFLVSYDATGNKTYVGFASTQVTAELPPHAALDQVMLASGTAADANVATFAAGFAGNDGTTVSMSFAPAPPESSLLSDMLSLQGTDALPQVLQLSYDPSGLPSFVQENLVISWLDASGAWVKAVQGNNGSNPITMSSPWLGSWASYTAAHPAATLDQLLGAYGVDMTTHTVWTAINHNSIFAITAVPEPAAWALGSSGLIGVIWYRWRPRGRGLHTSAGSHPSGGSSG
ncbi:MAG: beta strand repeat-containing protein [Planctomycetia bacterium]